MSSGDSPHADADYQQLPTDPSLPVMHTIDSDESTKLDVTAKLVASVAAGFFLLVTWILVFSDKPAYGLFWLHPPLMSLGIVSITYGIMTLQPTSHAKTKEAGLARHQKAMLFLGVPSILLGASAILLKKSLGGAEHFYSWHGTFGIVAVGIIILQALVGGSSVWFGGAAFGGGAKAKAIWKYHRLSGYILYPLLLTTSYLAGEHSAWAQNKSALVRLLAYTVAPAVMLVAVYIRMRTSKMKFF